MLKLLEISSLCVFATLKRPEAAATDSDRCAAAAQQPPSPEPPAPAPAPPAAVPPPEYAKASEHHIRCSS